MPIRRPRERGFTVLEVLVAFVLLATTLAVLLQLFSVGLRDAQLADEYARAVMFAQSRLAAYTAAEKVAEGVSSERDGPFTSVVSAEPYDESQESPDAKPAVEQNLRVRLLRVESRVAWHAADGRDRDVRLATLVLAGKP